MRTVSEPARLLDYLFAAWAESKRKEVRTWLKRGMVEVNGRVITQFDHALRAGDTVTIRAKGLAAPETKLTGGLLVRHEDEAVLVVEKPAGLLSIATGKEPERTAYSLLVDHVRQGNRLSRARVWIVHRLDRETSGLMIFAKSEAVKRTLQQHWESAEKKYFAVVEGVPSPATGALESYLDESDPFRVKVTHPGPGARRARTRYRVTKTGGEFALLELSLDTGRRHQIRVQLAAAGHPIAGDGRYGARTNPIRRVALHACGLRIPHPVTRAEMSFVSPLPGDLGRLLLGGAGSTEADPSTGSG